MNNSKSKMPAASHVDSPRRRKKFFHFWRCFWLLFLVVSLGYAWYCFYVPANNIAWADNYTDAQRQAIREGKPMILFISGKWCVPCRIMKRNVWADKQVTATVNNAFIPVTIDWDDPNAADVLSRYSIRTTPTTIITDPQGNVLEQSGGGLSKVEFLQMIEESAPTVD